MAEAPKPQRTRRSRRNVAGISSAAPTADTTTSGTTNNQVPRRRRRRRNLRRRPRRVVQDIIEIRPGSTRRRLTRAIKRELKREGLDGPKVSVQQKITSTFGFVRPNTTGDVELELNFFLHPSLAKEANEGTAFGPVQALAAQYSLWKLRYLTVKFTPMVGASAVSGTVVRASLNMSQSPGTSSWSGLGTRVHVDMHPGQTTTFHLRADQLGGPRDGGWWFTDTNEEGSQSAGPIVEVHTMGLTKSTFRDDRWDGPLFLVEGIGLWQFANYNVKPALGTLERREGNATVEMKVQASQPITMEMASTDSPAMFMDSLEPEVFATPGSPSVGETIFQIVDVGATLAQTVAPPPFAWLIKGGWWFVKKLLKRTRADTSEFVVYASLQDAQNNKPAIATGSLATGTKIPSTLMVTQMNSPNVGPNPTVSGTPRAGPQVLQPNEIFKLTSEMITELFIKIAKAPSSIAVPVTAIPGVLRRAGTGEKVNNPLSADTTTGYPSANFIQTPWWIGVPGKGPGENPELIPEGGLDSDPTSYLPNGQKGGYIHSLYRLHDPRFTNQSGAYEFNPPEPSENAANFCLLANFGELGSVTKTNYYRPVGKVVATSKIYSGTNPDLDMVFSLIKVTDGATFGSSSDTVRDMVVAVGDTANRVNFITAPPTASGQGYTRWNIFERDWPNGAWLLGVSYTNTPAIANGVDIPTFLLLRSYDRVESTFSSIFPYYLSGQMLPASSVDLRLKYVEFHPPNLELVEQLRTLNVPFTLPPCCDEASGKPGSSRGGEGGGYIPCILPPESSEGDGDECEESGHSEDEASDSDSVERFMLELGNEMIDFPKRWLRDPEFSRFLDM
uniref:Capsid protein n=1 Tax=Bat astrovirus 2 TaxID=3003850 RepID=A0AA49IDC9_9VIRU|nr:MAG: capsid protein [Bat astrovirus 2]